MSAKNLQSILAAQKAKEVKDEKAADAAAAKGEIGSGEVLVRLKRPAYLTELGFLPAGIHSLPADKVPSTAVVLKKGEAAPAAEDEDK